MFDADRRLTNRAISEDLDISIFTVHTICEGNLSLRKINARHRVNSNIYCLFDVVVTLTLSHRAHDERG